MTLPTTLPLTVSRNAIAAFILCAAVLTSGFVASEPAPTDALMLGAIAALPLLGVTRFGLLTSMQTLIWLAICACGIFATANAPVHAVGDSLKHQLITLYLVLAAFIVACFLREQTERRFALLMSCYVAACTLATAFAIIGYLDLVPGANEAFTLHGRARATFKDPNVYGAVLPLAIAWLGWRVLRGETRRPLATAALAMVLLFGVLISLSRGAWIAALATTGIVVLFAAIYASQRSDQNRLAAVFLAGGTGLALICLWAVQSETVASLLEARFSATASYDEGPHGRFAGQMKALALIPEAPFGIGSGVFSSVHHHEEPHQVYLSMFLMSGWLGGLLYIVSVLSTLAIGLYAIATNRRLRGPLIVATAAFAGVAIQGLVVETDHWRHVFLIMGLVWGLADAGAQSDAVRRDAPMMPARTRVAPSRHT